MTIIVQISDTHLMEAASDDARAPKRIAWLRRCVQDINGLNPAPDAVIHTGDMSQNGRPAEYELAWEILSGLDMPFYVTPGNRDSRAEMRKVFSQAGYLPSGSDFLQYKVDVGHLSLIAVDTVCEGSRIGDFCDERLTALDDMLGEMPDRPAVLFMHHPPFDITTSEYPFQFAGREAVEKFVDVVRRHPRVSQIFTGHSHRRFVSDLADIRAATVPSIAVDLRLGDFPEADDDTPAYQVHRFDPENGFSSEIRFAA